MWSEVNREQVPYQNVTGERLKWTDIWSMKLTRSSITIHEVKVKHSKSFMAPYISCILHVVR